jgi:hypothetical protein
MLPRFNSAAPADLPETPRFPAGTSSPSLGRSSSTLEEELVGSAKPADRFKLLQVAAAQRHYDQIGKHIQETLSEPDLPSTNRAFLDKFRSLSRKLRDLEAVSAVLEHPWPKAPDVDKLQDQMTSLLASTDNHELAGIVQEQLASKAEREGFLDISQQLRPIRDLKTPYRGVGGHGPAGEQTSSATGPGTASSGHAPSRPFPEAPATGLRPPLKERPTEGLPPPGSQSGAGQEDSSGAAKARLGEEIIRTLEDWDVLRHILDLHLRRERRKETEKEKQKPESSAGAEQTSDTASERETRDNSARDQLEREAAKHLRRPLKPVERLLVQSMQRHDKTVEEMAGILRQLESTTTR